MDENDVGSGAVAGGAIDSSTGGPLSASRNGTVTAVAAHPQALRYANGRLKRFLDLVGGILLSLLTLPLILVLAIGSAASFRTWPFFVQERLGRHGKTFRFIKLRTLHRATPPDLDKYSLQEHSTTRWGRMLRRRHLDELPQLWLVVSGSMSLVGPRPEMSALARCFDGEFVRERMTVRPGITGPWQVSEHKTGLIGEATAYDRLYVRSASLSLDWYLARQTVRAFLGGGPITLADLEDWLLRHGVSSPDDWASPSLDPPGE